MGELTLEQRRAMALAAARVRAKALPPNMAAAKAAREGTLVVSPAAERKQRQFDEENIGDLQDALKMGRLEAFGRGALQGVTFGFGDEAVAALRPFLHEGETYDSALANERQALELARRDRPGYATGGEVAGAVASPVNALLPIGAGGNIGARVAKGMGAGALAGGLYGLGTGVGGAVDRLGNAASSGILGGLIGGAIPIAGAGLKRVYDSAATKAAMKKAAAAAPSLDDLKASASAIYDKAKGAMLPRSGFAESADDMVTRAREFGIDPDLMPGASTVANRITEAADSTNPGISFQELDTLRRKAAVPAGNIANRPERALGTQFIEGIDNFVDNIDPALGGEISKAREMWSRLRKSELIDTAIEKAKNQASGFENGLRIQFRRILDNPKLSRGFSDAEKKAMKAVVDGTTFGNIMKKVGVMGLSGGQGGSGLGALTSTGFGASVGTSMFGPAGGVVGAMLPPAIGTVAKKVSERGTRQAAELARGLVASGGTGPVAGMAPEARAALEAAMRRGLLPFVPEAAQLLPLGIGSGVN